MPQLSRPRFVAPHFTEIDGGADAPGAVRRACAFTTGIMGPDCHGDGARHYHRCTLISRSGRWQDEDGVGWRTESWQVAQGLPAPLLPPQACPSRSEGQAADLMQAIASALGAAHAAEPTGYSAGAAVKYITPAFVEIRREAGLPRAWMCGHLYARGEALAEQPWTHLQTVLVREWPGRGRERYQCEVETLPVSAVLSHQVSKIPAAPTQRWWATDLEGALRSILGRLYEPGQTSGGPDLGL